MHGLQLTYINPYLVGAVVAAVVSWKWQKLMPTILIGMAVFFVMRWMVGVLIGQRPLTPTLSPQAGRGSSTRP